MCFSRETLEGLRMTSISSFIHSSSDQPGVFYFLCEKLCQDSLESFFGKQRMHGGHCP